MTSRISIAMMPHPRRRWNEASVRIVDRVPEEGEAGVVGVVAVADVVTTAAVEDTADMVAATAVARAVKIFLKSLRAARNRGSAFLHPLR